MKPSTNLFDPFGIMASGALAAWHMGWRVIDVWQRTWLPLIDAVLKASAGPAPLRGGPGAAPRAPSPAAESTTAERIELEALIARQQGRKLPSLGCLQGAGVVYPTAGSAPRGKTEEIEAGPVSLAPATRLAVQSARKAKPVKASASTAATPRKKASTKPKSDQAGS